MIVYGTNPVREAIRANPDRVRYVAVARELKGRLESLIREAKERDIETRVIPAVQLDRLAGRGVHNGVVAEVEPLPYADFDEVTSAESTNFVLLLDEVQDPQNLGAILRVADAFAVDLVVITEHESAAVTPAAVKASAGAAEWVRVAQVTNLARAIDALKERGYWVYGAAMNGDAPSSIDWTGRVALVLGNEGRGIRRNVLEHCDRTVTIPMQGRVDSLNVSTAAAVLCYEIRRGESR